MKDSPRRRDWRGRQVFTTGDVAKICGVSSRTVALWCDTGQLEGHRFPSKTPGHPGERRFGRESLLRFIARHGMTPALEALEGLNSGRGVLLVGCNGLGERLAPLMAGTPIRSEAGAFGAGAAFALARPSAVVIDVAGLGADEARHMIASAAARKPRPRVVAVVPEDWDAARAGGLGADVVLSAPLDLARLAGMLGE